jgi:2-keto-4-pentenoate hydratase
MRHTIFAALLAAIMALAGCASCRLEPQIGQLAADWTQLKPAKGLSKDMPMEDALCARDQFVAELGKTQGKIVGYKAGLTNKAVQNRFGYPSPVRGVLFEKMLLQDGAVVPAKFGARPVYEADLVIEVRDEGINQATTPLEVLKHTAKIYPFIELPDLVVAEGEPLNGPVITAINVGARLGVLGKPFALDATPEMVDALAKMSVVMRDQDGKELARGPGAAILDQPLNAVIWLAQDLAKSGGKLRAGDLLSLGSFSPLLPPKPGTGAKVTYEGLPGNPTVSVSFK